MKTNYDKIYQELLKLVEEIEDDSIQLDVLATKVKQAKVLIEGCEKNLRTIEVQVQDVISNKTKTRKDTENPD